MSLVLDPLWEKGVYDACRKRRRSSLRHLQWHSIGRPRGRSSWPADVPACAAGCRRDWLPADHLRRRQSALPARQPATKMKRASPPTVALPSSAKSSAIPSSPLCCSIAGCTTQIEGSSCRLRQHAALLPEHLRAKDLATPPPAPPAAECQKRSPKIAKGLITGQTRPGPCRPAA
jgi:hypothetical protein